MGRLRSLGRLLSVPLLLMAGMAGCIGEASHGDQEVGFSALYEDFDDDFDPRDSQALELSARNVMDRHGELRPVYRVAWGPAWPSGTQFMPSGVEDLDGDWMVVRTYGTTFEQAASLSRPNTRIQWEDGTQASMTGVGWLRILEEYPTVPVSDGGAVDVFYGDDSTQVRIHYPRPPSGLGTSDTRTAVYTYTPGALFPDSIVLTGWDNNDRGRKVSEHRDGDPLGTVPAWPHARPRETGSDVRAIIPDIRSDTLGLGYTHEAALQALLSEDPRARELHRNGCVFDYKVRFDEGHTVNSPSMPIVAERQLSTSHRFAIGDLADGAAAWRVQRYVDDVDPLGEGPGFEVDAIGGQNALSPCLAIRSMTAPELGLGAFADRAGGLTDGELRSVRAYIFQPDDPQRTPAMGWTLYEAEFYPTATSPLVRITYDAHQEWLTEAVVLGDSPAAFDDA